MNRWGASTKCRDSSTGGFDSSDIALRLQRPDAASSALSNAPCAGSVSAKHARPDASRQRQPFLAAKSNVSILLCLVFLLCCYSPCVAAAAIPTSEERPSILLFDPSPPPEPRMRLIKRAEHSATSSESSSFTTSASTSLPSAFDTALGNNFTTSTCPTFFQNFLSNDTFNECVPLSLLLQTSTSFFTVQRSPVRLAQTLSASCSVDFDRCSAVMASFARQIQSSNTCGPDLQAQNPMAMQAYDGFVAYEPLYHAGCLLNSDTGAYCFSDAVTNATSPTDSYVYYLPLGVSLPGTTAPSCSDCLQDTMSVFASAATNKSQPIYKVYGDAAKMIDSTCGAEFVNASIPHTSSASAVSSSGLGGLGTIALLISLLSVLM